MIYVTQQKKTKKQKKNKKTATKQSINKTTNKNDYVTQHKQKKTK